MTSENFNVKHKIAMERVKSYSRSHQKN